MPLLLKLVLIALINFVSAFVQGATGFGHGLISMALMPLFFPMTECSAISAVTVVAIGIQMSWLLRKELKLKIIIVPVIFCMLAINIGLYILNTFDELVLRIILAGLILFVTGLFFYTRRTQIVLKNRWYTGAASGLMAGVSTGMFNIVGPFLLVYYMGICKTTLNLKASLEFSFLLAGLYSTSMHIFAYNNITTALIPELTVAVIASIIAGALGLKIYKKIDKDKISKIIYIILPIMAINLIINGVL